MSGILFLVLCIFIGACLSGTNTSTDSAGSVDRVSSKKEKKKSGRKYEKERRRREEDAYEDMLMYMEVFADDDW